MPQRVGGLPANGALRCYVCGPPAEWDRPRDCEYPGMKNCLGLSCRLATQAEPVAPRRKPATGLSELLRTPPDLSASAMPQTEEQPCLQRHHRVIPAALAARCNTAA